MKQILYFCLFLVSNISLCLFAETFLKKNPTILNALNYNINQYKNPLREYYTSTTQDERERAARYLQDTAAVKQITLTNELQCREIFGWYFREHLKSKNFDYAYEIQHCGIETKTETSTNRRKSPVHMRKSSALMKKGSLDRWNGRTRMPPSILRVKRIFELDQPNAEVEDYPWTVYLIFRAQATIHFTDQTGSSQKRTVTRKSACTGSIIHHRFVLTAGQCIPTRMVIMENMILKFGREHYKYEEVKEKYLTYLEQQARITKNNVDDIQNVEGITTAIDIYYGSVQVDPDEQIEVMESEYEPIHLAHQDNSDISRTNVKVHEGFISQTELNVMELYRDEDEGDTDFPSLKHKGWGINNVAIIYLGAERFNYETTGVRPVCVPSPHINGAESFGRCSIQFEEKYTVAGYGLTSDYQVTSQGLSSAKFKMEEVFFGRYRYYSNVYVGSALKGQNKQMEIRAGEEGILTGVGPGDDGAAWLLKRPTQTQTNDKITRTFAMAICAGGSYEAGKKISGTDLLMLRDWIPKTMYNFHTLS